MRRIEASKITNKEMMNQIIDSIKELGYHPYNVDIGNCYFVFEGNDDSICHFNIKEIPGFSFGLWSADRFDTLEYQWKHNMPLWCDCLEIDSKSEVVFFTQYDRDLDKFKPSRSGFVTGLYRDAYEDEQDGKIIKKETWYLSQLEDILSFMKKHRIRSVEYAGCATRYIWEDDRSAFHLGLIFIKDWLNEYKYRFKDWLKLKHMIYVSKQLAKRIKMSKVLVLDYGCCWHPRIHIFIRRKDEIDLGKYSKEQTIIDKFEDKYFNNISMTQFDIDILADDLTEEDFEKDKDLKKRFYDGLDEYYKEDKDEEAVKLLYENS